MRLVCLAEASKISERQRKSTIRCGGGQKNDAFSV
jgi:hypothetical protein